GVRATAQSDPGDVALAGNGDGCEIVVSSDEHSAVHQAATFLADDIERISGYKPPIVSQPTGQRATVRLVTLAPSHVVPEAIARQRLDGHWEAYQIKTIGNAGGPRGAHGLGPPLAPYPPQPVRFGARRTEQ